MTMCSFHHPWEYRHLMAGLARDANGKPETANPGYLLTTGSEVGPDSPEVT